RRARRAGDLRRQRRPRTAAAHRRQRRRHVPRPLRPRPRRVRHDPRRGARAGGRAMTAQLPLRVGDLERRGLRDRVYDLILEMLLEGDVEPGSRLSIDTLAKQLDVSPTPVREAMVQLERTGLVTREVLKGYRVAPP